MNIRVIVNDTDGKRHPRLCRKCWKRIAKFLMKKGLL